MSIFDIFRSSPQQPQQQTTPQQQQQQPQQVTTVNNPGDPLPGTQATQQTAPNAVVPTQPASPLDPHKDIWQTPKTDDPNASNDDVSTLFAKFDPNKVLEAAGKVDFSKHVSPDTIQKIQAGGQEAVTALADALNKVSQAAYANSTITATKIVEQALTKAQESFDKRLKTEVRRNISRDSLVTENPVLNSPAVQPIVEALQQTLTVKNPNATASEINKQIVDFFGAVAESVNKKAEPVVQDKSSAGSVDWENFFGFKL